MLKTASGGAGKARLISEILHEEISGDLLQALRNGTVPYRNDYSRRFYVV